MVASKSKFFLFISRDDIGVEGLTAYSTHWKEQNMFDQHSLQKRSFDIISNFVSKLTRVWYLDQMYPSSNMKLLLREWDTWDVRAYERNRNRESSKNSILFIRRYFNNAKSHRSETESILQRKLRSFWCLKQD